MHRADWRESSKVAVVEAIYVRQSVNKKDSLSIDGQIELCKKYADNDTKIYCDRGFSAKNIKRPALTELIDDIKSGIIKKIYTYRIDRLSRSIVDFSHLWQLLESNGVAFQSVTENFDTSTPMGRAMLNIVMTFAQLERETTAERVRDNYIHRFSHGAWPGGPAPYGFKLTKISDVNGNKASALVADAEKARVVKRIFEMYAAEGASLRSVAKRLMQQDEKGPKREAWDNVTLSRILHNPIYVRADEDVFWYYIALGLEIKNDVSDFDGVHACNVICQRDRTKNKYNSLCKQKLAVSNHEGFIDSKLWLYVQQKLSDNRQIPLTNAGKYSWLTGLLKCADCGYALKINRNKADGKLYLLCSGKSNLGICDAKVKLDIKELEDAVEESIKKLICECPTEETQGFDNAKAAELLAIEQKIDRLVNALSACSDVSASYISKEIDKLHEEREKLKLSKIEPKKGQRIDFSNAALAEKRIIATQFIEKILVSGDAAEIIWKI